MSGNPSVTEVARNFSAYVNRVLHRGERFVLMRGKHPVAELRPVPVGRRLAELPALLASLPRLTPHEAEQFGAAVDDARQELDRLPPADPWAS